MISALAETQAATLAKRARSRRAKVAAKIKKTKMARPINLRVDDETRSLIDRAAATLGQSRTHFMLNSARAQAVEVLLNQTLFSLGKADWHAFNAMLDDPPPPNAKLKALLRSEAPWDGKAAPKKRSRA